MSTQDETTPTLQNHQYLDPKILLTDCSKNRERWLELRKGKITASTISTIVGLNPYKSSLQLWSEWTGKTEDKFRGNRYTDLGQALEPVVANWFSQKNKVELVHTDALFQDSELDWLVATPDYVIAPLDNIPLEIKTGNPRTAYKWENGQAPQEYVLQVQIQLRVLRKERGIIAAYLGDVDNLAEVEVTYDAELFNLLREEAERFLDHVQRDIPMEPGANDAGLIRKIQKREIGSVKSYEAGDPVEYLIAEAKSWGAELSKIRKQLEEIEDLKKKSENKIKLSLDGATVGELADGRVFKLSTINMPEKSVKAYSYDRLSLPK